MTILSNIKNEVIELRMLICDEVKSYRKELKEINAGTIDLDYSLARYLSRELELKDLNINNSGYVIIKKDDNVTTTLQRFILEYYSQDSTELKEILNNEEYEINHKNMDKLDNRIENLEIVTHANNIRHSKGLDYEVVFTTAELKEIQEISLNSKEQVTDRDHLKRISGLFYKFMATAELDTKLLKCCYLEFKNNINNINNNEQNSNNINKKREYEEYKLMTHFHTKGLKILLQKKKQYIYEEIIQHNLKLLNRYIKRYPYIEQVLKKYRLVDSDYKKEFNLYNSKNTNIAINFKKYICNVDNSDSRNILLDFLQYIYHSNNYIIKDGNILLTISIKYSFNAKGKYKYFLVAYLLGLLQRQNDISKPNTATDKYIHTPSFIKIPLYTDELLKLANDNAKHLLDLNLNKITYFIVAQEFGEEKADFIYKNKKCKSNYKYGIKAKEDIIDFIKTDKDIHTIGFITIQDIFDHIQGLNTKRSISGEEYNKIYNNFTSFISTLLLYNTETKRVLEELNLTYTTLTNKIIQNIKINQQKHGLDFTNDLRPKMKAIVPKKFLK